MLRPAQSSREMTPSSDKDASSDIAAHCTQEGVKGNNKWRKQHLQGTMISCDDGHDWEACGSDVGGSSTTTRSDKRPTRPPTDYFKRLLKEACPNHAYPVRDKLKDCDMMRSFMTVTPHVTKTVILLIKTLIRD
jgi:hypothetical protein